MPHTLTPMPPILFAMPLGLTLGGVQSWCVNLANTLAARGGRVGLLVHQPPADAPAPGFILHHDVAIFAVPGPPLEQCNGDLSHYIPAYRSAVRTVSRATASPVALVPTLLGDCFGIAAALATTDPEALRIIAWNHSPIPYESRIIAHYESCIAQFVGVSTHIEKALRADLPARGPDIRRIFNGVRVPAAPPPPRTRNAQNEKPPALRLAYVGRLEDDNKRVGVLPLITSELTKRGIAHELLVMGEGPAAGLLKGHPTINTLGASPPDRVRRLMENADLLLLPSRFEGLNLAMIEAMACGCVPLVARTGSGTDDAIRPQHDGLIIENSDDREQLALRFADAIESLTPADLARRSQACWAAAQARFCEQTIAGEVEAMLFEAVAAPHRWWPASRPAAFTAANAGAPGTASGTVPADAPDRCRALLETLQGRRVLIHGVGRHTLALADVLSQAGGQASGVVIGFTDDNPALHNTRLWNWPVINPEEAYALCATDVVISSWINQEAIWSRRAVFERQNIAVHRLYPAPAAQPARLTDNPAA